jgi:MFS family permease
MAAGYVADTIGRKRSFYVTAIGSGVGTVIEVTSGIRGGRFWQLVAGKLVICLAIGIASVSVPLYLAECAPGPIRGAMVNSYVWVQCKSLFKSLAVVTDVHSRG